MKIIPYFFRRKWWQIKNVFRWLPVIWNQFDFDYHYALDVFKFQLEKTATFMERDEAMTVGAKDRAKRIRIVLDLMKKVYDEDYALEYQDKLEEKYGKEYFDIQFIELEDTKEKEGGPYFEMKKGYELNLPEEGSKKIEEEEHKLFLESREKQEKAHKLLWKLIEHNIRGWWD